MKKGPYRCPGDIVFDVIGGKWKPLILKQLIGSSRRYNELHRRVPGVTHKMLSQQLRELEKDGIIERQVFPEIPPKVEYRLSELGQTIIPLKIAFFEWGMMYMEKRGLKLVPEDEPGRDTCDEKIV